jgi:hypothetical protein
MAEITEQLHYRKSGATTDIKLYDSTADMGSDYLSLRVSGSTAYAMLGGAGETEASDLRVQKGGNTFAVLKSNRIDLPSGFIAMFMGSCPTGWTRETAFDDKFIRAAAVYDETTDGVNSHTHSFTRPATDTTVYSGSLKHADGTGFIFANTTHYHPVGSAAATTTSGNIEPPYFTVVFCRKD